MIDFKFLALAAAGLTVAGCTGSTDPATATLFDNIANISSGEYENQLAAKEAEAASIVRANNARSAQISSLERQQSANSSQISALRRQIASVEADIDRARSSASPAEAAKLDALAVQVRAVEADANNGADPSVVRGELSRISAAVRALSV